jgi:Zn-dependent alcohol dehydrogenase
MRAAVCREFGAPLAIEELHLDPPETGEVRVDVAACAICHSDIHFFEGAWGGELPAVYGHEASGIVESVGAGVEAVRPGDRVVVSLIRSCGRCFFCSRGEPYLCEAEFPIDAAGRLRTTDGEQVLAELNTGAFAEQVVVHASQLAVVPDFMTSPRCLRAASSRDWGRSSPPPRFRWARASSSSARAGSA